MTALSLQGHDFAVHGGGVRKVARGNVAGEHMQPLTSTRGTQCYSIHVKVALQAIWAMIDRSYCMVDRSSKSRAPVP